jgi:hypothetical protein
MKSSVSNKVCRAQLMYIDLHLSETVTVKFEMRNAGSKKLDTDGTGIHCLFVFRATTKV